MKVIKNKGGHSLFEPLTVMLLLVLFAGTICILIAVGSGTFSRIISDREDNSDLRIGMSYITMRIRQNDTAGAISVKVPDETGILRRVSDTSNNENDSAMLVMTEIFDDTSYDTIIYYYNGGLYELLQESSMPFDPIAGEVLTKIDGVSFICIKNENNMQSVIKIKVYKGEKSLTTQIKVRSEAA